MEKYIFIISGKARHGKTTVANYIKDYYEDKGKKLIITEFSKYIKMYARDILSWDGLEETKPRKFLQDLGNDLRDIDNSYLVSRILDDIDVYEDYSDGVAIDDARLSYEIDYMRFYKKKRVKVLNVIRPEFDNGLSLEEREDITERELDDYKNYDYTIMNNGSLDELRSKVTSILEGLDI